MDNVQMQQEISIIREMIEKTKKETAESGQFFIWTGILSIVFVYAISFFESHGLSQYFWPILIAMVLINGTIGYLTFSKIEKREKVKTYAKSIYLRLWFASGMTSLLVVFLFPHLHVFSIGATPILVSLIMGIAIYTTGVIFDSRLIRRFSLVWWAGAISMGVWQEWTTYIMMLVMFVGFVVPGLILNREYKNRSRNHES